MIQGYTSAVQLCKADQNQPASPRLEACTTLCWLGQVHALSRLMQDFAAWMFPCVRALGLH